MAGLQTQLSGCAVLVVTMASAVAAASVTTSMTAAARTTMTAPVASAWTASPWAATHVRPAAGMTTDVGTAMMPAVPSRTATPPEAAPVRITAPVKAGTMPAIVVPAVIAAAEEELDLLHVIGREHRLRAADWHRDRRPCHQGQGDAEQQ